MAPDPTTTLAPGGSATALLLAVAALAVSAAVPLLVALIQRGGKSKAVQIDQNVLVPRSEFDRLVDQMAAQDTALHNAQTDLRERDRELQRQRLEVDQWQARAYRAGWKDES